MRYELTIIADTSQGVIVKIIDDLTPDLLELVMADRKSIEVAGCSYTYRVEEYTI